MSYAGLNAASGGSQFFGQGDPGDPIMGGRFLEKNLKRAPTLPRQPDYMRAVPVGPSVQIGGGIHRIPVPVEARNPFEALLATQRPGWTQPSATIIPQGPGSTPPSATITPGGRRNDGTWDPGTRTLTGNPLSNQFNQPYQTKWGLATPTNYSLGAQIPPYEDWKYGGTNAPPGSIIGSRNGKPIYQGSGGPTAGGVVGFGPGGVLYGGTPGPTGTSYGKDPDTGKMIMNASPAGNYMGPSGGGPGYSNGAYNNGGYTNSQAKGVAGWDNSYMTYGTFGTPNATTAMAAAAAAAAAAGGTILPVKRKF